MPRRSVGFTGDKSNSASGISNLFRAGFNGKVENVKMARTINFRVLIVAVGIIQSGMASGKTGFFVLIYVLGVLPIYILNGGPVPARANGRVADLAESFYTPVLFPSDRYSGSLFQTYMRWCGSYQPICRLPAVPLPKAKEEMQMPPDSGNQKTNDLPREEKITGQP
jgi:hypothetical protein